MSEFVNYLLATCGEEGGEVAQIIGKCLRFGINDSHPKTGNVANIELLRREVNDLIAVAEMLGITRDDDLVQQKKSRVLEYWQYAKSARGLEHLPGGSCLICSKFDTVTGLCIEFRCYPDEEGINDGCVLNNNNLVPL